MHSPQRGRQRGKREEAPGIIFACEAPDFTPGRPPVGSEASPSRRSLSAPPARRRSPSHHSLPSLSSISPLVHLPLAFLCPNLYSLTLPPFLPLPLPHFHPPLPFLSIPHKHLHFPCQSIFASIPLSLSLFLTSPAFPSASPSPLQSLPTSHKQVHFSHLFPLPPLLPNLRRHQPPSLPSPSPTPSHTHTHARGGLIYVRGIYFPYCTDAAFSIMLPQTNCYYLHGAMRGTSSERFVCLLCH